MLSRKNQLGKLLIVSCLGSHKRYYHLVSSNFGGLSGQFFQDLIVRMVGENVYIEPVFGVFLVDRGVKLTNKFHNTFLDTTSRNKRTRRKK